jgi:hypothetical protein
MSPEGDDRCDGLSPDPLPREPAPTAGAAGPVRTFHAMHERLRRLRKSGRLRWPVTVHLRGGVYRVRQPIQFSPDDSGPITFSSYRDERAIIDGGIQIAGFAETTLDSGVRAWVATVPDVAAGKWAFKSLFVNGRRAPRTLLPRGMKAQFRIEDVPGHTKEEQLFDGAHAFVTRAGDVQAFRNLTDVDVLVRHFWTEERLPIESWNPETRLLKSSRRSTQKLTLGWNTDWAGYQLENVFEALSEPGEWYLDRPTGKLYYVPMPGESIETTKLVAPRTTRLLALVGDVENGRYVEYLTFRDLTFRNTDWIQPNSPGYGVRYVEGFDKLKFGTDIQAAHTTEGTIELEAARYCAFEGCTIEHCGAYAISLAKACIGNRIVGCELHDLGAGGVKVFGAPADAPPEHASGKTVVSDNHIHAIGRVFKAGIGVATMHSHGNRIAHNHIHDTHYSGISVGWQWNYERSASYDNVIESNHIHHIGKGTLADMGGVYTLSVQPGTVIRRNLIHDVDAQDYGAWAIYPDEGTSHVVIEHNVCFRTGSAVFHTHYGRENIVRNNVFALGNEGLCTLGKVERHVSFTLLHNVLLADGQPIHTGGYHGEFESPGFRSDHNLVWDRAAPDGAPMGGKRSKGRGGETRTLDQLRALGIETHSVVADPKLTIGDGAEWSLAPDSPAFAVGFRPIDLSTVGPRPREKWGEPD